MSTDDEAPCDASTDDVIGAESEFVRSVNSAVGEAVKDARESKLWTIPDFVEQMRKWPLRLSGAQVQSNYEHGRRPMPIATFIAACWTMGFSPWEVMQSVAEKLDPKLSGAMLNLEAMIDRCETTQLRTWAIMQLATNAEGVLYWLSHAHREEMSVLMGLPMDYLNPMLAPFVVEFSPRR